MVHPRAQNQHQRSTFPFFELPPELRLNIYEFLLGGNTIHVGFPYCGMINYYEHQNPDAKRLRIGVCQASVSDLKFAALHRQVLEGSNDEKMSTEVANAPEDKTFILRHKKCHPSSANLRYHNQNLNLLLACKTIHYEAAATPFTSNTFTFSTPAVLEKLLRKLGSKQREALSNVLLYSTNRRRTWTEDVPATTVELLPHACRLTVFIELCGADLEDLQNAAGWRRLVGGLVAITSSNPRSIDVCVVDGVRGNTKLAIPRTPMREELAPARLDSISEEIRRTLLPPGAVAEMELNGDHRAELIHQVSA
ncbi:hypothetical protein B0A55_09162 [Friedmanniomyces simplex]|uniref:DUF7730 domain-containing protein n=1 Tax=Friedmanniomyces simplex TaxID=329884 RepID=A0A4U0WKM5_9PEZI|nr:hypothetical protein B0A55_11379 [Friedmanniomyces simplex]TKA64826.1 hypothetical protein B0A55_09162 [Friedmanniomyces simplex]